MTPFLLPRAERATWRDMLASPDQTKILLAVALTLFSALAFPLCDNSSIATVYLLVAVLFLYRLTQSFLSLLFYAIPAVLLLLFSSFLPGAANQAMLPTAFLCLLIGGSCGAFLFLHCHNPRKYWYIYTLPVVAYALPSLLLQDPLRGLLALIPLLLAALFAIFLYFCLPHTESVILGTVFIALALSIAGVVTLAVLGMLDSNPLTVFTDTVRTAISNAFAEMEALYQTADITLPFTDADISDFASLFINILPGLFIALCSITCYLIWRTVLCLLVVWQSLPRLPRRIAVLDISVICAIAFAVLALLSFISSSGSSITLFGAVCQNLMLILEPALVLVGFQSLIGGENRQRSCLSFLLLFGVAFVFFNNPLSGVELLAFIGAFRIVAARFFPPPDKKGEQ